MTTYHTQEYPDGPKGEPVVTTTTDRKMAIHNTVEAMQRALDRIKQRRAEAEANDQPG